jgi:hypothetical protein
MQKKHEVEFSASYQGKRTFYAQSVIDKPAVHAYRGRRREHNVACIRRGGELRGVVSFGMGNKPKKLPSWERTARLNAAVDDIRVNGRIGRSLPQIAAAHGVNPGSLSQRLFALRREGHAFANKDGAGAIEAIKSKADNSVTINAIDEFPTKLVENRGNEGVRLPSGGMVAPAQPKALTPAEIELERLNAQVGSMVDRSILVSGGVVQCKTPADLAKLYELRRLTLGLGPKAESGKAGPLVQVQILSQAVGSRGRSGPAIEAKAVRILESTTESGGDSAQS